MSVYFKRRAKAPRVVHASYNLTGATASNIDNILLVGKSYTTSISMNTGFNYIDVLVTMGGNDITKSVYSNGNVSIPSVTGDIVISAVAKYVDFRTWYINETPSISNLSATINFTSNRSQYDKFSLSNIGILKGITYYRGSTGTSAYGGGLGSYKWQNENFRTVVFDTEPTGTLRTWLEANAKPI